MLRICTRSVHRSRDATTPSYELLLSGKAIEDKMLRYSRSRSSKLVLTESPYAIFY